MFYVRLLAALLGFLTASLYGIGIALVRRDPRHVAVDYGRLLSRLTQPALGVRLEARGLENLDAERPCIYVVNHQSNFDVPVLGTIYPSETVLVAKKEIRSIPLFGWLYEKTGNILIDRSDRSQAIDRLRTVTAEIRRRGVSVWIFPEGTRGKRPGELLPFKKGAFQMAIAAQCPLVPIVVSPLRAVIDTAARRIRPGTLEVRVLEPIPTEGLTEDDVDRLTRETRQKMQTSLGELALRRGGSTPQAGIVTASAGEREAPPPPKVR